MIIRAKKKPPHEVQLAGGTNKPSPKESVMHTVAPLADRGEILPVLAPINYWRITYEDGEERSFEYIVGEEQGVHAVVYRNRAEDVWLVDSWTEWDGAVLTERAELIGQCMLAAAQLAGQLNGGAVDAKTCSAPPTSYPARRVAGGGDEADYDIVTVFSDYLGDERVEVNAEKFDGPWVVYISSARGGSLTPDEARRLAQGLRAAADEAERLETTESAVVSEVPC